MSRFFGLLMGFALTSAALSGNAWGQDDRASRERIALRRAQQQVQQALQEKTAMEEKLRGSEQERDKLTGQINGAQARAKTDSAKNQTLQSALDAMTQEKQTLLNQKAELDQRLTDLNAKHAGTQRELEQAQAQNRQHQSTISKRDLQVSSCEEKNKKIYLYGRELIGQCRDHSATDAVLRLEPFTGIKRVEIENILEEYRDKLDSERLLPADLAQ
jgi:chromosome segregation ATPase